MDLLSGGADPPTLSLPCPTLPSGAGEGCGAWPGAGHPTGEPAERAQPGSSGATGVSAGTREPAPEVGDTSGHGGGGQGRARQWGLGAKACVVRYRGLEQRLEAELQAAATSKEEALMKLKARALRLEEELFQVSLLMSGCPAPMPWREHRLGVRKGEPLLRRTPLLPDSLVSRLGCVAEEAGVRWL